MAFASLADCKIKRLLQRTPLRHGSSASSRSGVVIPSSFESRGSCKDSDICLIFNLCGRPPGSEPTGGASGARSVGVSSTDQPWLASSTDSPGSTNPCWTTGRAGPSTRWRHIVAGVTKTCRRISVTDSSAHAMPQSEFSPPASRASDRNSAGKSLTSSGSETQKRTLRDLLASHERHR